MRWRPCEAMTIRSQLFRLRGIDDRLIGCSLDLDRLACDACCLPCLGDGAKTFLGMLLHACFVLSRCVLDHLRCMKWRQDRQHGDFGADPFGEAIAVLRSRRSF
jgi:hypothetical protein